MRHTHHFVDELFNRDDNPLGKHLPLSALEVNPDQPRNTVGDIKNLSQSVKKHGILEPILVKRMEEGKYRIIAGERRYHAAMEAGLTTVPCIEVDILHEYETLELALVENMQRRDLDPFEEAQGFQTLKEKYEFTQEKIAALSGKSRSLVAEILTLNKIPHEIRELCRHADICARSVLVEIAKADNIQKMRLLVDLYASGADRESIRTTRKEEATESESGGVQKKLSDEAKGKVKPFVFKVTPRQGDFSLSLRFKREEVSKDEIISTLRNILEQLEEEALNENLIKE